MIVQIFHVCVFAYSMYVGHWMNENMIKDKETAIKDPVVLTLKRLSLRFLTNWTFTLQNLYFFLCVGEDILNLFSGYQKFKGTLFKVKNYVFTVLVAPMSVFVTVAFWSMWLIDRELIFPEALDQVLPSWVNHSLHTTTSLFVLGEIYLSYHPYPKFEHAVMGITAYLGAYVICLIGTYVHTGIWLYPIFRTMSWNLRIVFVIVMYILAIFIYITEKLLTSYLWGETLRSKTKKSNKKRH